jgi:hypothetical protein
MANSVSNPRDNFIRAGGFAVKQFNKPLSNGGSFDFFQGDLLWWDSAALQVKPLDSDAHAAFLVGVALRNAYLAPYASMQLSGGPAMVKNYYDTALFGYGGVFTFFSTSGETYNEGDSVFWGNVSNNPQIITKSSGSPTHLVGTVQLNGASAISGGSTVLVPVLVIAQIPVQTL